MFDCRRFCLYSYLGRFPFLSPLGSSPPVPFFLLFFVFPCLLFLPPSLFFALFGPFCPPPFLAHRLKKSDGQKLPFFGFVLFFSVSFFAHGKRFCLFLVDCGLLLLHCSLEAIFSRTVSRFFFPRVPFRSGIFSFPVFFWVFFPLTLAAFPYPVTVFYHKTR